MSVVIRIDPQKVSHRAFAVNQREVELEQLSVRATRTRVERLLAWAAPFERRVWALEGADGLGSTTGSSAVGARITSMHETARARTPRSSAKVGPSAHAIGCADCDPTSGRRRDIQRTKHAWSVPVAHGPEAVVSRALCNPHGTDGNRVLWDTCGGRNGSLRTSWTTAIAFPR